jgi:NADPH:quinone reductase-like Zn-dependent oxidoreductase
MARALAIAGREEKPEIREIPTDPPAPGQVRVAVEAASVNGIDAATAAGYLWDMLPHTFPVVLGRDFAGRVEAVADGVTTVQVGDRVLGVITGMTLGGGGIAETATIDANAVVAVVPEAVSSAEAAGLGLVGLTAAALVEALQLSADDVVLVSGATGGVGAIAVQLAAATGAKVIATTRPDGDSIEFVRVLGAESVVDYTADLAAAIGAERVTAVVHGAGDVATLAKLLRPQGRLASALSATQEQAGRDDIAVLPVMADASPATLEKLLTATAEGKLRVPVARTYDFEDAAQALADFGNHKLGKLVVKN